MAQSGMAEESAAFVAADGWADVVPASPEAVIADARKRFVEQVTGVALLLLDRGGRILTWNAGAQAIKGYRASEVIGRHFSIFYTPEATAVGHPQRELELAALTGSYTEDGWRMRKDGSRFWARVTIFALRDANTVVTGFGKVTLDLTEQRQKEEQIQNVLRVLEQTLRVDPLTGLPNRRSWDERIVELIDDARDRDVPLTVGFLDLDHFKQYNDQHGHLAGDALLTRAALAWRSTLRSHDMLARYGGEEFVIALPGCDEVDAQELVTRLMGSTPDACTLSAGLARWDGDDNGHDLLDRADRALYEAKAAGRNCMRIAGREA